MKIYSYLALGDSYTIGEQVKLTDSFPYQTIQLLRKAISGLAGRQAFTPSAVENPEGGLKESAALLNAGGADSRRQSWDNLFFMPPEIIATTGFSTDELSDAINNVTLLPKYDFVSLLIGVNNQYRGRPVGEFENEFEKLLQQAIAFAGGNHACVYVLSIPDWGSTPFAAEKNVETISAEIDAYNEVCKTMAAKYQTQFIDITASQRTDINLEGFLTPDQLHPSEKEYAKWAAALSEKILSCIS